MSKFIELAKKLEAIEKERDVVREELEKEMLEIGIDALVQDPDTKAVYKTYRPTGTFISFREIDYKRTNLPGEKGGGPSVLSKKEAQEAGFELE